MEQKINIIGRDYQQPHQPNRAERRKIMKEQLRQQKKIQRLIGKNNPHIFISCPECKSRDVVPVTFPTKDHFKCLECGAVHELSEMDVEL